MSFDVRAHLAGEAGASEIDDKTAAALAAAAYKDFATPFPPGWDLLFEQTDDPGGYDGRALHHPASKTLILANRGTEFTSFRDWEENFGAAIFGDNKSEAFGYIKKFYCSLLHNIIDKSQRYTELMTFFRLVKIFNIYLIGTNAHLVL